ncbi:MAG: hypothetical protein K8W52_36015 [Deltaproteobacteria bacterium]|nr:hypothetical protein [Deltaproteobacteria bacterium]
MKRALAATCAALALGASTAHAWEGTTTHAGLTEVAAQSSHLHARLHQLGFDRGLFEALTVPPEDAPALLAALAMFPPTAGFTPDARGRQFALAWLVAGAVLADAPFAANHFYDPATHRGWARPSMSVWTRIAERATSALPATGVAAPDWVTSKDNPLGLDGFIDQYAKAIRGATPGERSRAMAGALVAAGAILHVLEDMGSPSHVRGDARAHLDPIGPGAGDLGSRFERVTALAFGRLGIPGPSRVVSRPTLRGFFTTSEGSKDPGLAETTADHWFSADTLPRPVRIATGSRTVTPSLARPLPAPPRLLNLMSASQVDGTTLDDASGVCLARYRVERGLLSFWLDDDCLLAQAQAILPETASYATGALDFLFRGELNVVGGNGEIAVTAAAAMGAGTLELLSEDARGVRAPLKSIELKPALTGSLLAAIAAPAGARRIVAMFRGVDGVGERLIAVGAIELAP